MRSMRSSLQRLTERSFKLLPSFSEKEADERHIAREVAKVVHVRKKADKEAACAAWIAAQNTKRVPQTTQKGKRKASSSP
jgi:hypothetical protein